MQFVGVRQGRHLLWAALLCSSAATAQSITLPLTPLPQSVVAGTGSITVRDGTAIGVVPGDAGAAAAARVLTAHVKVERGLNLTTREGEGAISLVRDASVKGDEAYRLVVTPQGMRVSASGDRGLLYGAMTVAQLLSPDRAFGKPASAVLIGTDRRLPSASCHDARITSGTSSR